jgi:hypothetical protein
MVKLEKLVKQFLESPKNLRFPSIEKILLNIGFIIKW